MKGFAPNKSKPSQVSSKEPKPFLSSFQPKSSTTIDRQQLRKTKIIIKSLCQHNDAYDFKSPVDWKSLNLTDYPLIVKHPIDLGTIEKNLNNNKYSTVQQFIDDVQLIWDNCKTYNQAGSWIYQSAQKIERAFKKMVKNYFPDIPISIPQKPAQANKSDKNQGMYDNFTDEEITYYEKLNFCERVQELDSSELQELIQFLQKSYPESLHEVKNTGNQQIDGKERVQILVDQFTTATFRQANQLITRLALERGQKVSGSKKSKPN